MKRGKKNRCSRQMNYHINEILQGNITKNALEKLSNAYFDERLSVIGLLLSRLGENFKNIYCTNLFITSLHNILKELKNDMIESKELPYEILSKTIEIQKQILM